MRLLDAPFHLALLVLVLLSAACFNPNYASPGFACSTDVSLGQGCPPGQSCVASRCTDGKAGAVLPDLSSAPADLASGGTDLAVAPDLSSAGDLSVCAPKGGDCTYHNDALCCSKYCVYSTNKCK